MLELCSRNIIYELKLSELKEPSKLWAVEVELPKLIHATPLDDAFKQFQKLTATVISKSIVKSAFTLESVELVICSLFHLMAIIWYEYGCCQWQLYSIDTQRSIKHLMDALKSLWDSMNCVHCTYWNFEKRNKLEEKNAAVNFNWKCARLNR